MLKYVNQAIVFSEIPNEITLAIEISGCPIHCPACHSKYLWEDIGTELTNEELDKFINTPGITCICFMGGDQDLGSLTFILKYCHSKNSSLKLGWYSGREKIPDHEISDYLDYIKIGPYKEECGPINKRTTNQRMFQYDKYFSEINWPGKGWRDITYKFWKNGSDS